MQSVSQEAERLSIRSLHGQKKFAAPAADLNMVDDTVLPDVTVVRMRGTAEVFEPGVLLWMQAIGMAWFAAGIAVRSTAEEDDTPSLPESMAAAPAVPPTVLRTKVAHTGHGIATEQIGSYSHPVCSPSYFVSLLCFFCVLDSG